MDEQATGLASYRELPRERRAASANIAGDTLGEILKKAEEYFDACFSGHPWEILEVSARPHIQMMGSNLPASWVADIDAAEVFA